MTDQSVNVKPMPDSRVRRKQARPAEITEAALQVFAERGFAAARMDDIAARAGVSKGSLYLYFNTKEEVFHAVVLQSAQPNIERARAAAAANLSMPFASLAEGLMHLFTTAVSASALPAIARMVIGESRTFPDLAREWHNNVVSPMIDIVAGVIEKSQARGEVRAGDARTYALQLVSPLVMAALWRETFTPVGAPAFDLEQVVAQHLAVLNAGMLLKAEATP